jgi:WbqC-like protein family
MILSVHQPNFIPWIGYFHKIAHSDIFILLDQVQYPRGKSVANRNKIKTINGVVELVVPISKPKGYDGKINYNELSIADPNWHVKILKTIYYSYAKTPYFKEVYLWIEHLFQMTNFCEMNIRFIEELIQKLGLKTIIKRQSEFHLDPQLKNNDLILSLCKLNHATVYLSGIGAKAYNDPELYNANLIELSYTDFTHPNYPQQFGDFESHLSILDALFHLGFAETSKLLIEKSTTN